MPVFATTNCFQIPSLHPTANFPSFLSSFFLSSFRPSFLLSFFLPSFFLSFFLAFLPLFSVAPPRRPPPPPTATPPPKRRCEEVVQLPLSAHALPAQQPVARPQHAAAAPAAEEHEAEDVHECTALALVAEGGDEAAAPSAKEDADAEWSELLDGIELQDLLSDGDDGDGDGDDGDGDDDGNLAADNDEDGEAAQHIDLTLPEVQPVPCAADTAELGYCPRCQVPLSQVRPAAAHVALCLETFRQPALGESFFFFAVIISFLLTLFFFVSSSSSSSFFFVSFVLFYDTYAPLVLLQPAQKVPSAA